MNAPRDDYLTPAQHFQEAQRLLWVIDGELQSDTPRTIGDLAVIAVAHAVTAAIAVDVFDEDPGGQGAEDTRLDQIRDLLTHFDWATGDKQYALERIESIVIDNEGENR